MTQKTILVTVLAVLARAAAVHADNESTVCKPFEYSGYTIAEYKSISKSSAYVSMSDGVELAADIFRPADGPARNSFPVILLYTPYQRSTIDLATGRVRDFSESGVPRFFLSYGYGLVYADMRGTGASGGWLMDFMPRICDDGKELVDWIAAQPWCDGNIGMMGGSYLGWSQTAIASRRPKALKCIVPSVIPLDGYTGEVYPGGIYLQGFLNLWSGSMYHDVRNEYNSKSGTYPTTPVTDEDGDGELADEIPQDVNGNGTFLDDGDPPTYRDGAKRRHVYYRATVEHQKNHDYASWAVNRHFIDDRSPLGFTVSELGPSGHVAAIMESALPVYHHGGWFDGFARGSFELFCTMQKTNPSKILMAPSYHGTASGPFWKYLKEDAGQFRQKLLMEHLRFFDRYLKGISNGIDREPPIYLYVMHSAGWRFEKQWPLARQTITSWYLGGAGTLSATVGAAEADRYRADFSHSSSYGNNHGNRWLGIGGQAPNALPIRTEKDKQCPAYTGEPLPKDTEVTGHPIVRLWVSSTADDGDFFVYLEDVDDQGQAILVTEGQLRAGFARLFDNDDILPAAGRKIDVLPDLPWHGYRKEQYNDRIFAGGEPVELVIDLHPTAWVFRKGHRIRVSVACADSPTFRLHPKLCPTDKPDAPDNIVPTISIHRGRPHASRIDLPVIPE